jgi:hypothetical protein
MQGGNLVELLQASDNVLVTTPSDVLTSNTPFQVIPSERMRFIALARFVEKINWCNISTTLIMLRLQPALQPGLLARLKEAAAPPFF